MLSMAGSSLGSIGPSAPDGKLEQAPCGAHLPVDDQAAALTPGDVLGQGPLGVHPPPAEQVLELGKKRSATRSRPPHQAGLEPSGCRTLPKDWSERLWANLRLRSIPVTFRSSPTTVSYREASILVAWWHRGGGGPHEAGFVGCRRCVTPTSMPPASLAADDALSPHPRPPRRTTRANVGWSGTRWRRGSWPFPPRPCAPAPRWARGCGWGPQPGKGDRGPQAAHHPRAEGEGIPASSLPRAPGKAETGAFPFALLGGDEVAQGPLQGAEGLLTHFAFSFHQASLGVRCFPLFQSRCRSAPDFHLFSPWSVPGIDPSPLPGVAACTRRGFRWLPGGPSCVLPGGHRDRASAGAPRPESGQGSGSLRTIVIDLG